MLTVGTYEAKTHLPKLIERVENGETVLVTRHGKPVAKLVPAARPARHDTANDLAARFDQLQAAQRRPQRGEPPLWKLKDVGRKG